MDIKDLTQAMDRFVTEKGWYQPGTLRPQTPKNLAVSLCIEASEVLELFQWSEHTPDSAAFAGEMADVTLYLLQLAQVAGIDLERAVLEKLMTNDQREWESDSPVERDQHVEEN